MDVIDIDIERIKNNYKKDRKIIINGIAFFIGLINGARKEFILFNNGKKYPVITDWKEITFICF